MMVGQIKGNQRLRTGAANLMTLSFILVIYLLIFQGYPLSVFWSPDEGAKFIQSQSLRWNRGLVYQIPYPGELRDPAYQFYAGQLTPSHPDYGISQLYPHRLADGGVTFNWPIWFPLLSAPLYKLFGLPGLYLIPFISGLLTVALVGYLTARIGPALAPVAMLITGLASPLFFYSFLFWEHALAVWLGLAALAWACRLGKSDSRSWPLLGLMITLAAAVLIRLELSIFAVALLAGLVVTLDHPYRRRIGVFVRTYRWQLGSSGAIIFGGLFIGLRWLAWHNGGGLDLGLKENNFLLWFTQRWTSANFWLTLPGRLASVWVNTAVDRGPSMPAWFYAVAMAGILLALIVMVFEGRTQIWLLLSGGSLLGLVSFYILISAEQYRSLHGLFLVAPYLAFAATSIPALQREKKFELSLIATTALIYLALGSLAVMLVVTGGLEWGPRYLLIGYPLGIIAAVIGLYHFSLSNIGWVERWLLIGLAASLVIIGIQFEARGLGELRWAKTELSGYSDALGAISQPVVTDLYWLPAALAPRYLSQEIYLLPARTALSDWLAVANAERDTFVFAGFQPLESTLRQGVIADRPYHLVVESEWHRYGMTFTQFRVVEGQ